MILKPSTITTPNQGDEVYLAPVSDRWYRIPHSWAADFYTDAGRIHVDVDKDFLFDGRSGPVLVDVFVPNLGTQEETKRWLNHDLAGHGVIGLTFEEANDDLRMGLRDYCDYTRKMAGAIHVSVSASDSWFGEPGPDDKSYPNLAKIHVRHYPK